MLTSALHVVEHAETLAIAIAIAIAIACIRRAAQRKGNRFYSMNQDISMDLQFSEQSLGMQDTLRKCMQRHVLPAHAGWHRRAETGRCPLEVIESLKILARHELGEVRANRGATLPYYPVHQEDA
jgi:hypothetical protein